MWRLAVAPVETSEGNRYGPAYDHVVSKPIQRSCTSGHLVGEGVIYQILPELSITLN